MFTQPKDFLIMSLAVGDFIISSMVCPFGFSAALSKKWTTGLGGCVWYGFLSTWVGLASILQLTAISIERYKTLCSPTPNITSQKLILQVVIASWVFALIASCFPLMGWSKYTLEDYGLHCSILWSSRDISNISYCLFLLLFFFLIPIVAIAFAYTKIVFAVKRVYVNAEATWGASAKVTLESYRAQVKVSKQLFLITFCFLFAWTPYAVSSLLKVFGGHQFQAGNHEIPSICAKMSNIYNPVIYFFTYKRLRHKLFQMLREVPNRFFKNNQVSSANIM